PERSGHLAARKSPEFLGLLLFCVLNNVRFFGAGVMPVFERVCEGDRVNLTMPVSSCLRHRIF
ncbi:MULTISPECIES: hypothetical protein, partial [Pseudomonas syringae group]|uniref:hypothetical protein n=1 Tax=Pseudomonas syringae group TaxID=136849 RepID=UPI001F48DAFB